jgi:hypothetical protein
MFNVPRVIHFEILASAPGYQPQTRTGVSVTEKQVTSNINFQLPKLPTEQSGIISGTVQGEPNPIPEFQYPIAMLFVATLLALVLAKSFNSKAKPLQHD